MKFNDCFAPRNGRKIKLRHSSGIPETGMLSQLTTDADKSIEARHFVSPAGFD